MTSDPAADDHLMQLRVKALGLALAGNGLSVLHQTPDHRFDLADNPPQGWSSQTMIGASEADFMDSGLATIFGAATTRCLDNQMPQTIAFELAHGASRQMFRADLSPDDTGVMTILRDITEEQSREAAVTALLREVSHRSKNLLAIVQSVAMQTAHHTEGVREFLDKFRGRLHALSSTQDLVTESEWRGTHLQSLIRSQLSRVGHSAFSNVSISGENPVLGPNASLHIGLAIHELGANAVRHGALADGRSGSVAITAELTREIGATKLVLQWHEDGLDPTSSRRPPRFGTLVLERIVPLSVGGTAILSIDGSILNYRLDIPADQFES